jgi:hypothetical protein
MLPVVDISFHAIWAIYRLKKGMIDGPEAAVLYALAFHAASDEIFPGLDELHKITKISRPLMIKAISSLERKGLITVERFVPGPGVARGSHRYFFTDWPDDWLRPVTSKEALLVNGSPLTSNTVLPDLIDLKEEAYERTSGIGIEESESTRKPIRAQEPQTGVGRNGVEDPATELSSRLAGSPFKRRG